MVNKLVQFIIRQFAGKIAAAVASGILFLVMGGFAWLSAHYPSIAALCSPQEVAGWMAAFLVAVLNIAANKWHLDQKTVVDIDAAIAENPPVAIVRAEPVNKP